MRVAIGLVIANGFPIPAPFVMSWTRMMQAVLTGALNAAMPVRSQVTEMNVIYGQDFPIDFARNRICRLFLDEDPRSEYLLFLDADMTHPPETLHKLLSHGADVVTGRYTMRKPPFFSVAMRKTGDGPTDYQAIEKLEDDVKGLMPIDAAGAGCLLISRACLTAIRERFGDDWFRYQDGADGLRSRSEDMWFFERARDCGFQPWLDADLWCGHQRSEIVTPKDHAPYKAALKEATAEDSRQKCRHCGEPYEPGRKGIDAHIATCTKRRAGVATL